MNDQPIRAGSYAGATRRLHSMRAVTWQVSARSRARTKFYLIKTCASEVLVTFSDYCCDGGDKCGQLCCC